MNTEQFWARVNIGEPSEYWEWSKAREKDGYGQARVVVDGITLWRAHRVAWASTYGPIPDGLWVLHHCDNPPCCNPQHLWLGTVRDNVDDCLRKGRHARCAPANPARGERHGRHTHPERTARGERGGLAKLTEPQVREIRERYANGEGTYLALAREYGIAKKNIGAIVRRETWRHVA